MHFHDPTHYMCYLQWPVQVTYAYIYIYCHPIHWLHPICSVHKNHWTCRTFPMARPKCLIRDFRNLDRSPWGKCLMNHESFSAPLYMHFILYAEYLSHSTIWKIMHCICAVLMHLINPSFPISIQFQNAIDHLLSFLLLIVRYGWWSDVTNLQNHNLTFWIIVALQCRTGTEICVNINSGNGWWPIGTKPLPDPMLTKHLWSLMTFPWEQFHRKMSKYLSLKWV